MSCIPRPPPRSWSPAQPGRPASLLVFIRVLPLVADDLGPMDFVSRLDETGLELADQLRIRDDVSEAVSVRCRTRRARRRTSPTFHSTGCSRYAPFVMWVVPMFFAAGSRFFVATGTSAPSGISNGRTRRRCSCRRPSTGGGRCGTSRPPPTARTAPDPHGRARRRRRPARARSSSPGCDGTRGCTAPARTRRRCRRFAAQAQSGPSAAAVGPRRLGLQPVEERARLLLRGGEVRLPRGVSMIEPSR